MQWSKVKKRVRHLIAPQLRDRIDFHLTRYRTADDYSRAWITVDGVSVFSASHFTWFQELRKAKRLYPEEDGRIIMTQRGYRIDTPCRSAAEFLLRHEIHEPAEVYSALKDYPDLLVADALSSANPLTQALALVDRRIGARRLARIDATAFWHSLVKRFYELRISIT